MPRTGSRWLRAIRLAGVAGVVGLAVFCTLLLALRFVVFPRAEAHQGDIAALLSRALGQPVEIEAIVTGWDGWNPELTVNGLRIRDRDGGAAVVELPSVTGVVAWTSLVAFDLRLKELTIDRPRLAIRRDADGRIHVAGIEIDPQAGAGDTSFAEWLFRQPLIVVRGALITWNDEQRGAPQLVLDEVQLRLENRFGHHRFGLKGTPSAEIAAPIDVRGDLRTTTFSDWKSARGTLYVRLDYADVAAWSEWLPLPAPVESGMGAMRMWFQFAGGVARDVVADVELANVRTRLEAQLPPLDLEHLSGRLTWKSDGSRRTFASRELSFAAPGGVKVAPIDLELRLESGDNGEPRGGRIAFNHLELAPLSALAAQLPLPPQWRNDLARFGPRGTLIDAEYAWEGSLGEPKSFRTRGTFADVGINAEAALPGLQRITGTFEATQAGGLLRIASRDATLTLPAVFTDPIALDTVSGRVGWERGSDGALRVRLEDIEYANAHTVGTAQGTWRSLGSGPGEIDLTARLMRGDVRHLHRYLPRAIDAETRHWLHESLVAGTSDDARLTLKGDLAKFPFADGRDGTFILAIKGKNAVLDYAHGWPKVSDIDCDVRFEGHRMTIVATRGSVLGAALGRTTAVIPDLSSPDPVLTVQGEASGPTSEFLRFVDSSPVAGWIGHFTDGVQAIGDGKLALRFDLHLARDDDVARVAGDYQFTENQLRLRGVPTLSRVNGKIAFTDRDMKARDVAVEVFGGPALLDIASQAGAMRVTASGMLNLAALRTETTMPYIDRISGTTDWHANLTVRPKFASWTIESSLRGAMIEMPPPFGKLAADSVPLKLERRALDNDATHDAMTVDYGSAIRVVAHRRLGAHEAEVDRVLVLLGKAIAKGGEPERGGVTMRGDIASLDVDPWLELAQAASTRPQSAGALELQSVDLEANELTALGRRFDQANVSARRAAAGSWRARFSSKQIAGTGTWEPAGSARANGRLTAQLARFTLAGDDKSASQTKPLSQRAEGSPNPWPEVELTAERFVGRSGNTLGRMELAARPEGTDWRVTRFALVNDAGRIDADGSWRLLGRQQQTKFDVAIDVKDSAAFLAHMSLPGDVKGAPAKLEGQIAWNGSPSDFDYAALSGTFRVNVGSGQFTKLDPGVGKLLGVLSLQALPRRITLDFRDVFSEGFAFDSIQGGVRITNGVMHTDSLVLSGPAATVQLAGDVDLARETQALTVRVQPALSTTVSAGAGAAAVALLAANPLIGAAVGAGTLLAQKLMQDPIEQMFSYEYAVRGSWSEPVVERVRDKTLERLMDPKKAEAAAK